MKRFITIISFYIFLVNIAYATSDYIKSHSKESLQALTFYSRYYQLFRNAAEETGFSESFLFSIIAPEVSQFNNMTDATQIYALKVLYVQGGKSYANFSIGWFQIKPSFVELLEKMVSNDSVLLSRYGITNLVGTHG